MTLLPTLGRALGLCPSRCRETKRAGRAVVLRRLILALSAAGAADSFYLLLFQTGAIRHPWCPFFGSGCERISGSKRAQPIGIPDAIFGVVGYALLGALAAAGGARRYREQPVLPLALAGAGGGAAAISAVLTWLQWSEFENFCFWCLLSATISTAIFPLTLPEASLAWRRW